jgi:hypothetical protein
MLNRFILYYLFIFIFFGLIPSDVTYYKNIESFLNCTSYSSYGDFVDSAVHFSKSKTEEDVLLLKKKLLNASPDEVYVLIHNEKEELMDNLFVEKIDEILSMNRSRISEDSKKIYKTEKDFFILTFSSKLAAEYLAHIIYKTEYPYDYYQNKKIYFDLFIENIYNYIKANEGLYKKFNNIDSGSIEAMLRFLEKYKQDKYRSLGTINAASFLSELDTACRPIASSLFGDSGVKRAPFSVIEKATIVKRTIQAFL